MENLKSGANSIYTYERMFIDDLEDILEIERKSFLTPWTPDIFINEFTNIRSNKRVSRSIPDNKLIGYAIWWQLEGRAHLMNIAIDPDYSRKGIATFMMNKLMHECKETMVSNLTLEVRHGNFAAINMYKKLNFQIVGLKKNYYVDEGEDAILMELKLI